MTLLERWDDHDRTLYRVNGCLTTTLTDREIRSSSSFERLAVERLGPLTWLAMPGHEDAP